MNPRNVALTPEDGNVMRAIRQRRGDFALLNMATMDKVDAGIMRKHTISRARLVTIPRWRRNRKPELVRGPKVVAFPPSLAGPRLWQPAAHQSRPHADTRAHVNSRYSRATIFRFIFERLWDVAILAVCFFCYTQLDQQIRAALRPDRPEPTCWARVKDGVVLSYGGEGCLLKLPAREPPQVRFSYTPNTPEQAAAYRRP